MRGNRRRLARLTGALAMTGMPFLPAAAWAQVAVTGETVYTMAGPPLTNGVVLVENGRIKAVGAAGAVSIPSGYRTLAAKVVTPGLVDVRSSVGLSGFMNQPHDQDQRDAGAALQPELRAIDAYNPRERLVEWIRGFGVTTLHTGHGPGALVTGQTMVVKTKGGDPEKDTLLPFAMVAATLGEGGKEEEPGKSPGTRSKAVALLRAELVKAREYQTKLALPSGSDDKEKGKTPDRSLRLETLGRVLRGEAPLLVTVHRAHDILTVLRLREEFEIKVVLEGAAEAYLVTDQIKKAGVPVIVHPTMYRSYGERENLSMETASVLRKAGIPLAIESGFEDYVPKTRVVLFEAAQAAANGLTLEEALAAVTIDAARLLGVAERVGSLETGKDGDLALYDGDPFEYTSHCTGVVIDGEVKSTGAN